MNKSLAIIIILGLFFSVRYYVQSSQEAESMSYEEVQRDLDNIDSKECKSNRLCRRIKSHLFRWI